MANGNLVNFVYTDSTRYATARTNHLITANTIYFLSDTKEIYKGEYKYGGDVDIEPLKNIHYYSSIASAISDNYEGWFSTDPQYWEDDGTTPPTDTGAYISGFVFNVGDLTEKETRAVIYVEEDKFYYDLYQDALRVKHLAIATEEDIESVRVTIDEDLSGTSENPVQNQAVTNTVYDILEQLRALIAEFIGTGIANLTENYYTKTQVDELIEIAKTGNFIVVDTLPTTNISKTSVYLLPPTTGTAKEMWINPSGNPGVSNWIQIGNMELTLTDYVKVEDFELVRKNTTVEIVETTLTPTNPRQLVVLPTARDNTRYMIHCEVDAEMDADIKTVYVTDKTVNNFKVAYTGTAEEIIVRVYIQGGFDN